MHNERSVCRNSRISGNPLRGCLCVRRTVMRWTLTIPISRGLLFRIPRHRLAPRHPQSRSPADHLAPGIRPQILCQLRLPSLPKSVSARVLLRPQPPTLNSPGPDHRHHPVSLFRNRFVLTDIYLKVILPERGGRVTNQSLPTRVISALNKVGDGSKAPPKASGKTRSGRTG